MKNLAVGFAALAACAGFVALTQTAGGRFPIKLLRDGEKVEMQIRSFQQRFRK